MTPLKIHNGVSYALMEYLNCSKCVIFHAVTDYCYYIYLSTWFTLVWLANVTRKGLNIHLASCKVSNNDSFVLIIDQRFKQTISNTILKQKPAS